MSRVAQLGKLLAVKEVRTYIDMWLKVLRSVIDMILLALRTYIGMWLKALRSVFSSVFSSVKLSACLWALLWDRLWDCKKGVYLGIERVQSKRVKVAGRI